MLGFVQDGFQRYVVDIGPLGPDKGAGRKIPDPAARRTAAKCQTAISSRVRRPIQSSFAMRGFQVDGKTDQAVALMKQTKVYALSKASTPPPMQFLNGSNQNIDTLFPDNFRYFELLAMLVEEEPAELFRSAGARRTMRAIGIEKGKPFAPDEKMKAMLAEAARIGGAMARANTYGPPPGGVLLLS